jgi:predicted Zn-dependent peptidase
MRLLTASAEPSALGDTGRYVLLHRPGADVTTVSVWILAGSRHEPTPGVAHLFEHVVMQSIPAGRPERVVDEIEAWGGDANAMTARDHVVLHARVPTADAAAALGVLIAAATTSDFDDELVEAEQRVVLEELRLAASDPTDIVHDVFFEAAYGDHPMGRPVGGTPDGVTGLGAADVTAWSRLFVRPALLGVVACGGLTEEEFRAVLLDSPLADLGSPGRAGVRPPDSSPAIVARRRDVDIVSDTAGVVIGGPGFALSDQAIGAGEVVIDLLAGGNASVLTEEIRSRRGLSYDVAGGISGYRETGSWRIAISTAPEHCEPVVELATGLITDAVRRGWTQDQVSRASRRVAGLARVEAESSLEETLRFGDHAYVGEAPGFTLTAHLAAVAALTADQVNEAAAFMTERLVVATAGAG